MDATFKDSSCACCGCMDTTRRAAPGKTRRTSRATAFFEAKPKRHSFKTAGPCFRAASGAMQCPRVLFYTHLPCLGVVWCDCAEHQIEKDGPCASSRLVDGMQPRLNFLPCCPGPTRTSPTHVLKHNMHLPLDHRQGSVCLEVSYPRKPARGRTKGRGKATPQHTTTQPSQPPPDEQIMSFYPAASEEEGQKYYQASSVSSSEKEGPDYVSPLSLPSLEESKTGSSSSGHLD